MRHQLVILDFDGTFTDVEAEAGPFFASYLAQASALLGEDVTDEFARIADEVAQAPAEHGWTYEGKVVAPGNADPYLRATIVFNLMLDARGAHTEPEVRRELLQKLYFDNYPKADTVFRPEAKRVVETLLRMDRRICVVTNSATDDVQKKIDELAPEGRDQLSVFGDARKFVVEEPAEVDARFGAVPETMQVEGLKRPVLLRRGPYYELLTKLWDETGAGPESTLVAGDIFELDLALPAQLGCDTQLVLKERTEAYERAGVAAFDGGSESASLDGILERLEG